MTTFNGSKFLHAQLDSLINQTVLPLEILIGDDGSTDETINILIEFASRSCVPVRIFQNKSRLGYGRNFLTTAQHATGDLIAFCDQDDVWNREKISRIEAAFQDSMIWVCSHRARLINSSGVLRGEFNQGIVASKRVPARTKKYWPVYYGFSICVRRHLVQSIINYLSQDGGHVRASAWTHDGWVSTVGAFMADIYEIDECLVDYRQHDANAIGVQPERETFSTDVELNNNKRFLSISRELADYFDWLSRQENSLEIKNCALMGRDVYGRIQRNIASRDVRQSVGGILFGWFLVFRDACKGEYREPYDGSFKFRWFVHDLIFMPRRFLLKR